MILNIARVFITNLLLLVSNFLLSMLYTRVFAYSDYAFYQTFQLYLQFVGVLHLGYSSGLYLKYGGKEERILLENDFHKEISFLLILLIVESSIILFVAMSAKNIIFFLIGVMVLPINIIATFSSVLQAVNQFKIYTRINNIIVVLNFIIIVLFYLVKPDMFTSLIVIITNIILNWAVSIYFLYRYYISSKTVFSLHSCRSNFLLIRTGVLLMIGNFSYQLFSSIDKFFVKEFYNDKTFAIYSYALAMQSFVNILINSIAAPLYPYLSKKADEVDIINKLKRMILIFCFLSGSVFFVCSLLIKLVIPNYFESLAYMRLLFLAFPPLLLINSIIIPIFKAKNKIGNYINSLFIVIIISVLLNSVVIYFFNDSMNIVIATNITLYIWLILMVVRKYLLIERRDFVYILMFILNFLIFTTNYSIYNLFLYLLTWLLFSFICYKDDMILMIYYIKEKLSLFVK